MIPLTLYTIVYEKLRLVALKSGLFMWITSIVRECLSSDDNLNIISRLILVWKNLCKFL